MHLVFGLNISLGRDERRQGLVVPFVYSTVQGRPPILQGDVEATGCVCVSVCVSVCVCVCVNCIFYLFLRSY